MNTYLLTSILIGNDILIIITVVVSCVFLSMVYMVYTHKRRTTLSIEVWIPEPIKDPNRMILSFPSYYQLEDPEGLRYHLDMALSPEANRVIVKVNESRHDGSWVTLRKGRHESWEVILQETKRYIENFFCKTVEFHTKKVEQAASG